METVRAAMIICVPHCNLDGKDRDKKIHIARFGQKQEMS